MAKRKTQGRLLGLISIALVVACSGGDENEPAGGVGGEAGSIGAGPCPTGQQLCADECVSITNNLAHCGGCDQPCSGTCSDGVCSDGSGATGGSSGSGGEAATSGSGGASASGGSGGTGASATTGGVAGTGAVGGSSGLGGASGTAGTGAQGGTGGFGAIGGSGGTGGFGNTGATGGTGGFGNTGGTGGTGGASGTAGNETGGTAGDTGGTGGDIGGNGGDTGGVGGATGGNGGDTGGTGGDTGGCGPVSGGDCPETLPELCGMTEEHNVARANVSPAAVQPLPALTWDSCLQESAQAWADNCVWEHSNTPGLGENMYASAGGGAPTPSDIVGSWVGEVSDYNVCSDSCSGMCGHYTQVVWDTTLYVGCAISNCTTGSPFGGFPNWYNVVCQYDPPGNYNRAPYTAVTCP